MSQPTKEQMTLTHYEVHVVMYKVTHLPGQEDNADYETLDQWVLPKAGRVATREQARAVMDNLLGR